jgi:hypothetical protein
MNNAIAIPSMPVFLLPDVGYHALSEEGSNPFVGNHLVNNHLPCSSFGHKQENDMCYPINCIRFTILNIPLGVSIQRAESSIITGRGPRVTGSLWLPLNIAGPGTDPGPRFDITKCEVPDFPADK